MSLSIWSYPTRIVFGVGAVQQLGPEARAQGMTRALVVTDPGVERAGLGERVRVALAAAGVEVATFSGVSPNPTEADIAAGAAALAEHGADGVVAVGGGSPMDAGKLIVTRAATARPWEELDDAVDGGAHIPKQVLPVITVPTTSGTGSEVGRAGVLTVKSSGRKTVVFAPQLMPRVAVLDPELTVSMPLHVTAATGFDALTHCIEAYLAVGDHPMADAIAMAGIDLVNKHLGRACAEGKDLEARGGMMKAAMMGAVAFQKGLGACHSLAHPLSSLHGLHHGLANALCLPAVLDFNEERATERVVHVGLLLGGEAELGACSMAVRKLRASLGLPGSLRAQGIREEHLAALADQAIDDACHRSNPRPCTRDDLLALYRKSL